MIATLIFGNGIGMALDADYFQLTKGLTSAWNDFPDKEQKLISLGTGIMPTSEEELERHHRIMTACQELTIYENSNVSWLTNFGQNFPKLYQNFIYKSAKYFFSFPKELPEIFVKNLCQFISSIDRCHIATLNYDKLLYKSLVDNKILDSDKGKLVDGIYAGSIGFCPENLLRSYRKNLGWYLHLHGSPIFHTTGKSIDKCNWNNLPIDAYNDGATHNHLVLATPTVKPEIIDKSQLLGSYFEFFTMALFDSDTLYIVGYNGGDRHVNFEYPFG